MNIFDSIQESAFNVVTQTFGYAATWTPSEGGPQQLAVVCYKDATDEHGVGEVDYNNPRHQIEYKIEDFTGLQQSVFNGGTELVKVTMKGITYQFLVRRCETKYDGKTIVAYLNPPTIL